MGPFPHDAPRSTINEENPAGTDGFEFVEFAHPEPQTLRDLFASMGFGHVATHKTKAVEVWQQGDPSVRAATTVFLPEVPAATSLLDKLEISPKVLTPNGDGVGDQIEVRFALLKTDAPVEVNIFSLDGRLVGSLSAHCSGGSIAPVTAS